MPEHRSETDGGDSLVLFIIGVIVLWSLLGIFTHGAPKQQVPPSTVTANQ